MANTTRMTSDLRRIAADLPTGTHPAHVRQRVEAMEKLLERAIRIPGTDQRFGLDVLLDLIPIGGDFIGAALGLYMVWEARNLKMSKGAMARMVGNVGFDWLLGLIPVVGIVPDFFFRSNSRNLKIIKRYLDRHHPATVTIQR